jgi:hypothetical protein
MNFSFLLLCFLFFSKNFYAVEKNSFFPMKNERELSEWALALFDDLTFKNNYLYGYLTLLSSKIFKSSNWRAMAVITYLSILRKSKMEKSKKCLNIINALKNHQFFGIKLSLNFRKKTAKTEHTDQVTPIKVYLHKTDQY